MAYGAGGAAAAHAAAVAQAIKASGAIVSVEPEVFIKLISRVEKPLVVVATGGTFKKNFQYLTAYKGLFFFTKAPSALMLPGGTEVITAEKIWIPG
jgi:hypothetical protein